jgi:hypothetical protein
MEAEKIHIIAEFTAGADQLQSLTAGLTDEQLDQRPSECEWSIRQNIFHLADDLDVWSMCIKKAIATPGAIVRFEGFPGNEAWAEGLQFDRRTIVPQLELIRAHRRAVAELASHFSEYWDRAMCISDAEGKIRAELNVQDILVMLTQHTYEHLHSIEQILEKVENADGSKG